MRRTGRGEGGLIVIAIALYHSPFPRGGDGVAECHVIVLIALLYRSGFMSYSISLSHLIVVALLDFFFPIARPPVGSSLLAGLN